MSIAIVNKKNFSKVTKCKKDFGYTSVAERKYASNFFKLVPFFVMHYSGIIFFALVLTDEMRIALHATVD